MSIRNCTTLAAPLLASLVMASLAQADQVVAYLEGSGLSKGAYSYDCDQVASTGRRGHVQARARGEDIFGYRDRDAYSVESGTSQSTQMYYEGKRHRAFLESHVIDTGNGTSDVDEHCRGNWTNGFVSSGTTNVSSCGAWIRTSLSSGGSCGWRYYSAYSMGNTN